MAAKSKLTDEQREDIKFLYLENKLTKSQIIKKFEIDLKYLKRVLQKFNIKNERRIIDSPRKYNYNRRYFNNIETQDQAYWLGILASDGYIQKCSTIVGLCVADEELVINLKNSINGNIPIVVKQGRKISHQKQFRIHINSKEMINDLEKWGIIQNKAYRTKIPKINEDLIRHFIRGYFDGDGGIYIKGKRRNITITSCSREILKQIQSILQLKNMLTKRNHIYYPKKSKAAELIISSKEEVIKFLEFIYLDANLKLIRKYNLYLNIKNMSIKIKKINSSSKYYGVYYNKNLKNPKYSAVLKTKGHKKIYLGNFIKEREAALAYNSKIKELSLPDYMLNKIEENSIVS